MNSKETLAKGLAVATTFFKILETNAKNKVYKAMPTASKTLVSKKP